MPAWLHAWSVPLPDIDVQLLEWVLHRLTAKADGRPMSAEVVRRRHNTLGAVLRSAVRRGRLGSNAMERIEWRTPSRRITVDIGTVPSPRDVEDIVEHVASLRSSGARFAALFATVGVAGMRPSEAMGLHTHEDRDEQPETVHEAMQGLAALALALGLDDNDIRNVASFESTASSAKANARARGPS